MVVECHQALGLAHADVMQVGGGKYYGLVSGNSLQKLLSIARDCAGMTDTPGISTQIGCHGITHTVFEYGMVLRGTCRQLPEALLRIFTVASTALG